MPQPAKHCPCSDRDTTLPSGPEKGDPSLLPPVAVIGLPLLAEALGAFVDAIPTLPFLPPPLHVLKCLWLC